MSTKSKTSLGLLAIFLLWAGARVYDYFDPSSIAHLSMSVQLKLFASAMYEFHRNTGRWPSQLDDLSQTSLPLQSRVWRQTAEAIVFLWPQTLKDDPKENRDVLLAYWKGGLYNELGRVWVIWGDLRTEHFPETDLRARLKN